MQGLHQRTSRIVMVCACLALLSACSKTDDEQLKEDVAAIRAIKEKEQADQEASKAQIKAKAERAAAYWRSNGAASAPANSASAASK